MFDGVGMYCPSLFLYPGVMAIYSKSWLNFCVSSVDVFASSSVEILTSSSYSYNYSVGPSILSEGF